MTTSMFLEQFDANVVGHPSHPDRVFVTVRNSREVTVYDTETVSKMLTRDGEITFYGTPEQLRDLGRAIAEGAESIIKKAADEAAATNDSSMVADAVASVQGGGAGA